MSSEFISEMFGLIADRLEYNLAATAIFWVVAVGIWPYFIWMLLRTTKKSTDAREEYLVIVRGGGLPTEYHFSK